jgi:hypothetical protein
MRPVPTRLDLHDASALTFINGLQCRGLFGLLFMYSAFLSMIFGTRRAPGCLGVLPAIGSPRSLLLVSYWEDEESLKRFIGAQVHVGWMRFLSRHPGSLRLFNETYAPPLAASYIGKPYGYAAVEAAARPKRDRAALRSLRFETDSMRHRIRRDRKASSY